MNTRIEKLLQEISISPSLFADAIGVQRATISHILSGRNNPSLDFVQKLLARYPRLNPDWILSGKGEMWRDTSEIQTFEDIASNIKSKDIAQQPKLFVEDQKKETEKESAAKKILGQIQSQASFKYKLPEKAEAIPHKSDTPSVKPDKKEITKVILFYNDHTFEAFSGF